MLAAGHDARGSAGARYAGRDGPAAAERQGARGAGEIQLVDVREDYEWDAGRIAGATHIEMQKLSDEADSIDRATPVVFVCRTGARSGMAARAFGGAGYEAHNLEGGLWRGRQRPSARARRRGHGRRPLSRLRLC